MLHAVQIGPDRAAFDPADLYNAADMAHDIINARISLLRKMQIIEIDTDRAALRRNGTNQLIAERTWIVMNALRVGMRSEHRPCRT